jgi:septum formation topological specificity factor MinE
VNENNIVIVAKETDGKLTAEATFNNANASMLLRTIAYAFDVSVKGDTDGMRALARLVPEVVDKYIELSETEKKADERKKAVERIEANIKLLEEEKRKLEEELNDRATNADHSE